MSGWTPERLELLKALHAQGLSFSAIARHLGGATRNACIGKARRAGCAVHEERKTVNRQTKAGRVLVAPPPPPAIEEPPLTLEDGAHVTGETLTRSHCRWPIGDPALADFHFCGRGLKPGSVYCPHHHGISYQPQPQKRRRIAA